MCPFSNIVYIAPLVLPISPTKNTKLGRPCEKDRFMSRNWDHISFLIFLFGFVFLGGSLKYLLSNMILKNDKNQLRFFWICLFLGGSLQRSLCWLWLEQKRNDPNKCKESSQPITYHWESVICKKTKIMRSWQWIPRTMCKTICIRSLWWLSSWH